MFKFFSFIVIFYSFSCYSEVSVFETSDGSNYEIMLIYPDGELDFYSKGLRSRQSSNVKYCNPDSGWVCIFSRHIIIAIPAEVPQVSDIEWCFGGLKFKKINKSLSGDTHYNGENGSDFSISIYDDEQGIKFIHFTKGLGRGYNLVSREGLLGDKFINSISPKAFLTPKEVSVLFGVCPETEYTLKNDIKREILNIRIIDN